MQTWTERPAEGQDTKNVLEPNARIYAYTKGDAEAGGSKVVTSQLPVAYVVGRVLTDSGATHSFIYQQYLLTLGIEVRILLDKPLGRFYRPEISCCQVTGYVLCQ